MKMDIMIEQLLDNIATKLRQKEDTKQIGYDIAHFSDRFTKVMVGLRQCQELSANVNKAVTTLIPEGKNLSEHVWQTFESYGMWTAEHKEIADRLDNILTGENILNEVVDSILAGCECKKR